MATSSRAEHVLLLAIALSGAWLSLTVPVFAQESYYWAFSQHPALSYSDHPPMVAWMIWIGTAVFGDGAVGIRVLTWVCGMAAVWVGLRLLEGFGTGSDVRIAWLVLCLAVPIVTMTRFLANPDSPLLLFSSLCLLALWRAREGRMRDWLLAGAAAGAALLSKYTATFLCVGGIIVLLLDPRMRKQLLRPGPWLALLTAAVLFLPVIVWNIDNGFESFRFQTVRRYSHAELGLHWVWQCVVGQVAILHPVVAVLIPVAAVWSFRRWFRDGDQVGLWVLAFGIPLPLYLLGNSFWIQVKINWFLPAYYPLLLGLAMWWTAKPHRPRTTRVLFLSLLAPLVLLPLAPALRFFPQRGRATWAGWEEITARAQHWEEAIDNQDGVKGNVFFFAANHRDAAQLARQLYLRGRGDRGPGQRLEPKLAQDVVCEGALQFERWQPPERRRGQDAIFVLPHPDKRSRVVERVRTSFDHMSRAERVNVRRLGIHVVDADIYICRGYRGPPPPARPVQRG